MGQPWEGALRVLRDVIVQSGDDGELVVVSVSPGVLDDVMTLDLAGAGSVATLKVRVLESRPVVIEGAVRHRLRLAVLESIRRPEPSVEDEQRAQAG